MNPKVNLKSQISNLRFPALLAALAVSLASHPQALHACIACTGRSDSAMALGMNWGIFSLLAVIVSVLGTIAGFFIFIARRSAAVAAVPAKALPRESADGVCPQPRIAPARGHSAVNKRWMAGTIQRVGRLAHLCARGRAGSGAAHFGSFVRSLGSETHGPKL
jgi:hypothetical protein